MLGRVTFQKTCQSLAPSVRAASSSLMSMASKIGISSRTTNGSVTNSVASAIPERSKKEVSLCRRITALWRLTILTCTDLFMNFDDRMCQLGKEGYAVQCLVISGTRVRSTWEGEHHIEACSSQNGREPPFPPIQQHQHQACTVRQGTPQLAE